MNQQIYTLYTLASTLDEMCRNIPDSDKKPKLLLQMCDEIEKQLELVKTNLEYMAERSKRD